MAKRSGLWWRSRSERCRTSASVGFCYLETERQPLMRNGREGPGMYQRSHNHKLAFRFLVDPKLLTELASLPQPFLLGFRF